MTGEPENDPSTIERLHRTGGRGAFMVVVTGLVCGLLLFLGGQHDLSVWTLSATFGLLLALPVVNVLAVLATEIRRRDWTFAAIAAGVLAMLAYSVIDRIWRSR